MSQNEETKNLSRQLTQTSPEKNCLSHSPILESCSVRLRGQDLTFEQSRAGGAVLMMLGHEPLWKAPAPLAGLSTTLKRAFAQVAAWTGCLLDIVGSDLPRHPLFSSLCSVSFDKYPLMYVFSICLRYFWFSFCFLGTNKMKRMLMS